MAEKATNEPLGGRASAGRATTSPQARRDLAIGYLAAGTAVTIWAAWIIWARASVSADYGAPLTAVDVGLLRFGVPMLLLAPVWLRPGLIRGLKPPSTSWPVLLALLGWGAPFVLLAAEGMKTTEVAHVGALIPGVMPLWTALFAWLLFAERFSAARRLGLACVALAATLVVGPPIFAGAFDEVAGAPWLIAAAASWASFSLAFGRSGLGPVQAAGIVAAYSTIALAAAALVVGSRLGELSLGAFAWQAFTHGALSGAASIVAYAMAIEKLGPTRAASLSALVPVLAALMGAIFLGEHLGARDIAAIAAASLGVALINGAFGRLGGGRAAK